MREFRGRAIFLLYAALSGCSTLPDVAITDTIANEAKDVAQSSLQVVKPEHAKRFDDPAWPAPIQIVPTEKNGELVSGEYFISVFGNSGSDSRIETLYVSNAYKGQCKVALEQLGYPDSENAALIRVGAGRGSLIRCGNVVIASDSSDLTFRHPFISSHYYIELVTKEAKSEQALHDALRKYPISIRYLSTPSVTAP